ncbi:hypothetical protein K435DRAFT_201945 [Dendrothele bispora CBS 962.96]|uniref:Uncharacterized protein n=1 Tax=Dendrothele bispora (strain CBS 962.96) TaxID=1314807 RepID=A0A4S8MN35_DENBC|nr:hypothetical protein K435DRAFT_201945 [Dendrothele bispora CBS 962.96]
MINTQPQSIPPPDPKASDSGQDQSNCSHYDQMRIPSPLGHSNSDQNEHRLSSEKQSCSKHPRRLFLVSCFPCIICISICETWIFDLNVTSGEAKRFLGARRC